ncbi:conjugal transfer protein TraF [Marinomonas posidonica]|uniref:ThiS, thiamine-biosynthesis protein n=1 Tax=Marinomonas posidonica (strain CECT 7376 / NCIMB 14433 / IVIA-Po-181) TaxID=491952 RepID=F6CYR9_MARPP|nr:conjugal transfer protein TraF [Marinomonas posidonica]AEF55751.1 ThiS, thiamine-biosynthesis protein [Marinomonas posidonica IVIA-Po-181]
MKKFLVLTTSLLSTAAMAAMPVNQPIGSSFTLSGSPNKRALATALANPAAPFLMVNEQDDDNFRFGILGPLSIGVEMGDVSDLDDRTEEIEDILDATYTSVNQVNSATDDIEDILDDIAETAYVKTAASIQVPLMPVIYKTKNNGAFMLDASVSAVAKANVLSSDVTANTSTFEIETDASFQAQTAVDLGIGLGYSQSVWENSHGMLVGGVKATLHNISLGQALVSLDDDDVDADDAISDSIDDDAVESSGVGIDLGAVWVSHNYQLGLTLANVNEPEFDGVSIDTSCSSSSCSSAQSLSNAGKLDVSGSKYVMEMQTTVDFAVSTSGKQISLGMSYDTNSVEDAVGDEYQWAAASLSYYGDSHFLPGLRVGYRQNMAGTELSYATAGLTILKRLNLDVAVALETVEDEDGDEIPRGVYFALGYDTAF